jgi:hypothetical protein
LLKADVRVGPFVAEEVDVCIGDTGRKAAGGEELRREIVRVLWREGRRMV